VGIPGIIIQMYNGLALQIHCSRRIVGLSSPQKSEKFAKVDAAIAVGIKVPEELSCRFCRNPPRGDVQCVSHCVQELCFRQKTVFVSVQ
jgi:hypothetical protein